MKKRAPIITSLAIILLAAGTHAQEWGEPVTLGPAIQVPQLHWVQSDGEARVWGLAAKLEFPDVPVRDPEKAFPGGVLWLCTWDENAWHLALIADAGTRYAERFNPREIWKSEGPDGSLLLCASHTILFQVKGLRARRLEVPAPDESSRCCIYTDSHENPWLATYNAALLFIPPKPDAVPVFAYDSTTDHGKMLGSILQPSLLPRTFLTDSLGRFWPCFDTLSHGSDAVVLDARHVTPEPVQIGPEDFRKAFGLVIVDETEVRFKSDAASESVSGLIWGGTIGRLGERHFLYGTNRGDKKRWYSWQFDPVSLSGQFMQVDVRIPSGHFVETTSGLWFMRDGMPAYADATGQIRFFDWRNPFTVRGILKGPDDTLLLVTSETFEVSQSPEADLIALLQSPKSFDLLRPDAAMVQDSKRNIYAILTAASGMLDKWDGQDWSHLSISTIPAPAFATGPKLLFTDSADKVWVVGLGEDPPCAVLDTNTGEWGAFAQYTAALVSVYATGLDFRPSGGLIVPIAGPNGWIVYRTESAIYVYDGSQWHQPKIANHILASDFQFYFTRDGRLRYGNADGRIEFDGHDGWLPMPYRQSGQPDAEWRAAHAAKHARNPANTCSSPGTSVTDDMGRTWALGWMDSSLSRQAFGRSYCAAKNVSLDAMGAGLANRFRLNHSNPGLEERLKFMDVLIDVNDNAFLRVEQDRHLMGNQPAPVYAADGHTLVDQTPPNLYFAVFPREPVPAFELVNHSIDNGCAKIQVRAAQDTTVFTRQVDDGAWSELVAGPDIEVPNLAAGRHQIAVRAVNGQTLQFNPTPLSIAVDIGGASPPAIPPPVTAPEQPDIQQAIKDLTAADFQVREQAVKTLVKIGKQALEPLRAARPQNSRDAWWFDAAIQQIEK